MRDQPEQGLKAQVSPMRCGPDGHGPFSSYTLSPTVHYSSWRGPRDQMTEGERARAWFRGGSASPNVLQAPPKIGQLQRDSPFLGHPRRTVVEGNLYPQRAGPEEVQL